MRAPLLVLEHVWPARRSLASHDAAPPGLCARSRASAPTVVLLAAGLLAAACGGGGAAASRDVTSPTVPASVQAATLDRSSLRVAWQASTDDVGVAGYRISRDGAPLASVTNLELWFTDTGLPHGASHCYTVTAFDGAGNQSSQSPGACATTDLFVETLVDSRLGAGSACSIATDAAGHVHMAYQDTLGESFRYIGNSTGHWAGTSLAMPSAGVTGATAIAVDAGGNVHIAFPDGNAVQYVTNTTGSWVVAPVATGAFFGGLALDSAAAVHLGTIVSTGGTFEATVTSNETGAWVASRLTESGCCGLDIALDAADRLHVAYDGGSGTLRYGTDAAGPLATTLIDADGTSAAIAVDADGAAHVAYGDSAGASLHYGTDRGGGWTTSPVASSGQTGIAHSIALDAGGHVHLSASSMAGGLLSYWTDASGSWASTVLDFPGAQLGNDLTVDGQGDVHICHLALDGLRYATTR